MVVRCSSYAVLTVPVHTQGKYIDGQFVPAGSYPKELEIPDFRRAGSNERLVHFKKASKGNMLSSNDSEHERQLRHNLSKSNRSVAAREIIDRLGEWVNAMRVKRGRE
jgi:hypothetical protein